MGPWLRDKLLERFKQVGVQRRQIMSGHKEFFVPDRGTNQEWASCLIPSSVRASSGEAAADSR